MAVGLGFIFTAGGEDSPSRSRWARQAIPSPSRRVGAGDEPHSERPSDPEWQARPQKPNWLRIRFRTSDEFGKSRSIDGSPHPQHRLSGSPLS